MSRNRFIFASLLPTLLFAAVLAAMTACTPGVHPPGVSLAPPSSGDLIDGGTLAETRKSTVLEALQDVRPTWLYSPRADAIGVALDGVVQSQGLAAIAYLPTRMVRHCVRRAHLGDTPAVRVIDCALKRGGDAP
jgi:hypothetical protein